MWYNKLFESTSILSPKLFFILIIFKVLIISYVIFKSNSFNDDLKSQPIPISISDKFTTKDLVDEIDLSNSTVNRNSISTVQQESLPWHKRANKFENLNKNIIYAKFDIPKAVKRERFNIILIVSSAPTRTDRRAAIRDTWWTQCKSSVKVSIKCVFLTDWKDPNSNLGQNLISEAKIYGDLYFQNLTGGHDFGKRFLYHMVWSMQNIDFDYFIRLDDDYFVCMERFLDEIPMPPKRLYHWGWVHCIPNLVRPEESIILLSKDIIETFLGQDSDKILCNRWADQMIGIWNNELHLPKFYHHDIRLHHDPPARDVESFKSKENICTDYIGVHGSYPIQMRTLWNHRGPSNYDKKKTLEDYSHFCWNDSIMDWERFVPEWRVEPKLCKTDPNWGGTLGSTYIGRQGSSSA